MIVTRPLALLTTAALTIGAATATAPAAVASSVTAKAPVGAGYVAAPNRVSSASMVVRVPTITCGPRSTTSIKAGMFGTIDDSGHESRWILAVVSTCTKGAARYQAGPGGGGPDEALAVRPGDRIKLIKADAESFEVDDLTSGSGDGGQTAQGPGAPKPVLLAPVLFGVQVSGAVRRATHITVLRAHVSRTRLNQVTPKPKRQRQLRNGSDAATVAGLRSPGAFGVTVDRT